MWSIIKLLSCNMSIYDVYFHTQYFDLFVWSFVTKEVGNITMQHIISSMVETYDTLIGKVQKLFIMNWFHQKSSCDIRKFFIKTLNFTIEWRCISACCSLNYDAHVMTFLHEFREFWQRSIFINSDKCNFLILIPQYSDKKFDYVKMWTFFYG